MKESFLRDKKTVTRIILFVLALVIAAGAFSAALLNLGNTQSGYQEVDYTPETKPVLYASGVHLLYQAGGSGSDARRTVNEARQAYSALLLRGYQLLNPAEAYENLPNLASLNAASGQWVALPDDLLDILRDAKNRTAEKKGYSLFAGPLYSEWTQLLYLDEPAAFDPENDPEEQALLADMAAWARRDDVFSLDIEAGRARLTVSPAYTAWASEHGIDSPVLDLNLLHDAYLLRLVARGMTAQGYAAGYLYADSGISVTLEKTGRVDFSLFREGQEETMEAANLSLAAPAAFCQWTSFPPSGQRYGYYTLPAENGSLRRHPYVSARTGEGSRWLQSAVLGGALEDAVDLAYGAVQLFSAETEAAAAAVLRRLDKTFFAAYTLQGDGGKTVYALQPSAERLTLNEKTDGRVSAVEQ